MPGIFLKRNAVLNVCVCNSCLECTISDLSFLSVTMDLKACRLMVCSGHVIFYIPFSIPGLS